MSIEKMNPETVNIHEVIDERYKQIATLFFSDDLDPTSREVILKRLVRNWSGVDISSQQADAIEKSIHYIIGDPNPL